jgi:POT family proton-dependent oligopeptide transporter
LLVFFGLFMGGLVLVSLKPAIASLSTPRDVAWLATALMIGAGLGVVLSWFVTRRQKGAKAAHPLARVGQRPEKRTAVEAVARSEKLSAEQKKRIAVIGILFVFSAIFWMAFEQAGSSLTLFADKVTRNSVLGWEFDASYFQSVNSVFIVALAPVFSWLWLRMGNRQPSSPAKFSYGLVFAGLGFVVLAFASTLGGGGVRVSPAWLILVYLLHTIGELCLSPVGLSTVTKLAPAKLVGLMMGVWFLSISLGNYAGGWVAGFFDPNAEGALVKLFGYVAVTTIAAGLILVALAPRIRRLMGNVH